MNVTTGPKPKHTATVHKTAAQPVEKKSPPPADPQDSYTGSERLRAEIKARRDADPMYQALDRQKHMSWWDKVVDFFVGGSYTSESSKASSSGSSSKSKSESDEQQRIQNERNMRFAITGVYY